MESVPASTRPLAVTARENLPLILMTAGYIGAALVVQATTGSNIIRELGWTSLRSGILFGLFFTATAAGSLGVVFLLSRLLRMESTWAEYRRHLTMPRLGGIFIVFLLFVPFLNVFVGFKRAIPEFQPFAWDAAFMQLDRLLHLGRDPWEILQPVLGYPLVTSALDFLYYIWFPVEVIVLLLMAWAPNREFRCQFLLTFFSLWIVLGTVMATAFSSAGPVYYGRVTGRVDPYVPLMEYLHHVDSVRPLTALDVQAHLWSGYSSGAMHLIEGIAAMPSLHVALPVLYALAAWKLDRRLGILFAAYALLIFLGSVHLGWHYAVDGYVTLLIVPMVWWLWGKAFKWQNERGCRRIQER
jgi:hypothetical protein